MQQPEFGVFLPVANGGWIVSKTSPDLADLWAQNRAAAIAADEAGLDFIMSMGKWRGFGGETNHWGESLESLAMMCGLAEVTQRVKLWATIHPLLQNPAVAAKMIATLDHISGGRAGLNIVAGAYQAEFEQMGAWAADLTHDDRYALAEEWTQLIKRLWAEPSVTHEGRFFSFDDCKSDPKPVAKPRPTLISAGQSDRGFEFAVREADACFVGGRTPEERRANSLRAKAAAERLGATVKTYAMCTIVHAETDAQAQALAEHYRDGVDMAAIFEMLRSWGVPPERMDTVVKSQGAFMTHVAIGSPKTCTREVEDFIRSAELDGLMLIFPDYAEGLTMFGRDMLPSLKAAFA